MGSGYVDVPICFAVRHEILGEAVDRGQVAAGGARADAQSQAKGRLSVEAELDIAIVLGRYAGLRLKQQAG